MSTENLKAAATGKTIDKPRNISDLSHFLAGRMGQIKSVIASQLTPEKMARIALNELRSSDYLTRIALQNPGSFVNSVVQAAHLGLEIGGSLGQAYLVPFKGEIKMMPGYRGLISLARRSGEISSINAEIVYENDLFDLDLGIETKVKHKPCLDGDRGEPKLVYMVAHFKDGGSHFEWMTVAEVMKIKSRSSAVKSGKETPWDTDRDEMIKKTIIRRGWKYLPMSIEMQSAEKIDSANESGKQVVIEGDGVIIDGSTGQIFSEQDNPESKNPNKQTQPRPKPEPEPELEPELGKKQPPKKEAPPVAKPATDNDDDDIEME
ncbi:recombination protein RecT [Nitrosomonas aestuarii]|uniref:Recombination protein RecT n=1 Tax=Nitrosomonas aestuarii TaxID=52441 RepID=A0A1I4B8T3_9PROT|nr:recombinase RecT [Nitrosomonas aestuarii]SFK64507.1 recombination protein RecT [Nitrosomonas aestuarii]